MAFYVVTENVTLNSGDAELKKSAIFSDAEVSAGNLKRWMEKGYIKRFNSPESNDGTAKITDVQPFYMTAATYLSPKEINSLKQTELVSYGRHIGVKDINPKAGAAKLRKQIMLFIEEARGQPRDPHDESGENGDSHVG